MGRANSATLIVSPLMLALYILFCLLFLEAAIYGLDEIGRRARLPAIFGIVVHGGLSGLDLRERHSFVDHALNTLADDHHHVAVVTKVAAVADPPVARDENRS